MVATSSCPTARGEREGPTLGEPTPHVKTFICCWLRLLLIQVFVDMHTYRACHIYKGQNATRILQCHDCHRFTVNPKRRIRQHNGEIVQGACKTKRSTLTPELKALQSCIAHLPNANFCAALSCVAKAGLCISLAVSFPTKIHVAAANCKAVNVEHLL